MAWFIIILVIVLLLLFFFLILLRKSRDFLRHNGTVLIAIFTIILVLVTGYYAWQTNRTVKIMEASNRPYLEIAIPSLIYFDANYQEIKDIVQPGDIKYLQIVLTLINHGPIPAKLINAEVEVIEMNHLEIKEYNITVYDQLQFKPVPDIRITDDVPWTPNKINIELKIKVRYKIHGATDNYEAYNHINCTAMKEGDFYRPLCWILDSYTI